MTLIIPAFNPTPPSLSNIGSGANAIVTQGWSNAQNYASSAVTTANTFLNGIQLQASQLATLPILDDALGSISRTIGAFVAPTSPTPPATLIFNAPGAPVEPAMVDIVPMTVGAAPVFTAVPPTVDLNIGIPAPLSTTLPSVPVLPVLDIPIAPSITLPLVPTLLGISVPTAPILNLPTFTAVLPNSPLAPDYIFSFQETAYTSSLLDDLRERLEEWIEGTATGLDPTVEAAIWNRGRDREVTGAARKAMEAMRSFATRGFRKPPGMLSTEIQQAAQDAQDASSTINRDVMIKQAELEQENRKFAFDQAFKVESELIGYNNLLSQRAFDTAKYAQQVGIDIYHEEVAKFQADVQAYSARVEQWKAAVQAELARLEIYRSELEAQKIIGELNAQSVQIYAERVRAAQAVIEIFKAQVEAVNAQAMINKTQIDSYAAQVGAYGETVRAKAAEYEGYATRVKAEVSKADIFKALTDAYSSQTAGFKTMMDANIAAKQMEIKLGRDVPLDLFKTRTEVYRSQIQAEGSRVGAIADVFSKNVQLYSAQVQGQTGRMEAEANAYRAEVNYQQAAAGVRVEVAKSNVEKLIQKMSLLIDAAKAGSQVSSQMAASALSAVHLSGSLSDSASVSASNSFGIQQSVSYGASASESNAISTSTATQTSNSSSNATNYNYAR